MHENTSSEFAAWRRRALLLVWVGLLWNVVEAAVALWAGVGNSSVALVAFGLKSIIELAAGGVLVWRLQKSWVSTGEEQEADRMAQKLIGITFLLLAAYIALNSAASLGGWIEEPQPSAAGVAIILGSVVVMSVLYVGKMRLAVRMRSRALRGEAMETLMCDVQDMTILIGVVLMTLFGWWWADPVAALALIPFLLKEARENLSNEHEDQAGDRVCFCRGCWYGFFRCRAVCCAA